jgi:hypothetical protein
MVPATWRTLAVGLLGIVIGALALAPAFGKGGGGTLSGKTHVDVKLGSSSPTGPTQSQTTTMKCPQGNIAVGGGIEFEDPNAQVKVTTNGPTTGKFGSIFGAGPGLQPSPKGWTVHVINQSLISSAPRNYDYAVGVVCANVK